MNDQASAFLDSRVAEQIAHVEEVLPREAVYGDIQSPVHPLLQERMDLLGVQNLFQHQAAAYDAVMAGRDVMVTTGTNSGKTLCYNLPALQMSLTEPSCRCLYLFPTKALAQDQLSRLEKLAPPQVRIGAYDGDTPQSQRSSIRKLADIVLTNPDMLHIGILPGHENWVKFLKSIRLIVIDEMHVYRGVFGSNVAGIIRRLLRLCEWHRTRPQIVGCSATIGNPEELFEKLTGRKPLLIDQDGSPSGKRTFVFWNPPQIGSGQRLSANVSTSEIVAMLAETNQKTLAFSRSRVGAELVLRYTRKKLKEDGQIKPEAIESYRAGYTPKERRTIEKALHNGSLMALSATNAMELGVDVGGLDAVVLNGYPGTSSSFWQQAGRAGRGTRDGLAVYVAHDDPLEQYLIRQPGMLLNSRNENVSLNPANPQILSQQLLCAAHERPIAPSELERFGDIALEVAESLDRSGELQFKSGLFFYPSFDPPAPKVNIRGSGGETVRLYLEGEEMGSMEKWRAMTSAHEGAVYLHRGAGFMVVSLDLVAARAEVVPFEADYYTQSIVRSVLDPLFEIRVSDQLTNKTSLISVSVTDSVEAFKKKSLDGDTVLSIEDLDLPPQTFETVCVRIDLPNLWTDDEMAEAIGAIHGVEHALMAVAPLFAGCDRGDIGSAWYTIFPDTMRAAVFVFDRTPGGVGLCEKLFENLTPWLRAALDLVASCECTEGCPACLLSARCEVGNEALDKPGTIRLLKALLP